MARSRRSHCAHEDDDPVYRIVDDKGYEPPDPKALHVALRRLADVLNALPGPLEGALSELTPPLVSTLLTRAPIRERTQVLRALGMPKMAPRSVGQALCRDVLTRLSQVHIHDAMHASTALTIQPRELLQTATRVWETSEDDTPDLLDVTRNWPAPVLRLALWSGLVASVRDARMVLWAGTQPWWLPPGLSAAHGESVLAAARQVVAASPDLAFALSMAPFADDDHVDELDDGTAGPMDTDDAATGTGEPSVGTHPPAEEAPPLAATSSQETALTAEPAPTTAAVADVLAVGRAERELLAAAHADAVAAAHRITAEVEAGKLPDSNDVAAVTAYASRLEALTSLLGSAQVDDPALVRDRPSLAAADAAIAALERAAEQGTLAARLGALHWLTPVASNPALEAQVAALHATVEDVTGHGADADPQLVEALLALGQLAELLATVGAAQADPAELAGLQTRAMDGLPTGLTLLPVAVLTGQLVLSHSVEGPAAATSDTQPPTPLVADDEASGAVDAAPSSDTSGGPLGRPTAASGQQVPAVTDPVSGPEVVAAPETAAGKAPIEPHDVPEPTTMSLPGRHPVASSLTVSAQAIALAGERAASGRNVAAEITSAVANLLVERRFGLAAVIGDAAGWSPARATALRLATLADVIRGETGPSAARLRSELARTDGESLAGEASTLLLAVPALLRAALVTGDPTSGALLTELAPRLASDFGVLAEQVGRRALQGVLLGNPLRSVLADVTELEGRLQGARDAARERLARPNRLRFKRATDIAHRWLVPDGFLGSLLTAAANDDRSRVRSVTASVMALSDHSIVSKEIDTLDKVLKGNSGRRIEGAGRQDLFSLAADVLAPVSGWLEAVTALEKATSDSGTWATAELTDMRTVVLAGADATLAAIDEQTPRDDALAGAAAVAARTSLERTFALLDGTAALAPGEPLPDIALTGELLKIRGACVDPTSGLVRIPVGTDVSALLEAAALDWAAAFIAKLDAEEYPAARFLLTEVRSGTLPGRGELDGDAAARLEVAEHRSREELQSMRDELLAQLRRARLQNEISEEQDDELTGLIEAADPCERRDLDAVRVQLTAVGDLLPDYREESARRLRDRLRVLTEQPISRVPIDDAHIQRIIDDGMLSTAEELIYFLEIGESVPTAPLRDDFTRFFPAVPDALADGLTTTVIDAARFGGTVAACPILDFGSLSPETRADVATALETWRLAGSTPPEGRSRVGERALLLSALRLAGFEFPFSTKVNKLEVQKGRERRFVELTDVSWNGKPMVPQFASKLAGRLRVLLAWGQPTEDLLMSWVDHDTSGEPILVAYFGTMPAPARRRLAARTVRTDATVIVLDDAALAYLAAHGERQIGAAMAILLPFSAVQPYVRHKRSLVAPEMFYGRDSERKAVLAPEGTQVIFGGRGLGKSALLRDAKVVFEGEPGRVAIHIELTTAGIGPNQQGADAVWDVLLRDLETVGVVPTAKTARRGGKSNHEVVRAGVLGWLAADARHRLLILLDESDGFFEADAPRFLETNRLKDLGQLSGVEGRAKVVFAGLHSVQRFAKMSNNTFKHLAQRPTVIGPLRPQFAYDLIARPMETLGYTFDDSDLVNRILGYCSYQPFLLQMFGHRLVEHMHGKRTAAISDTDPPFTVTRADVEAVIDDPDLKADITSTFSDTLNLDARYNVIANVLAWHAYEHGMDARLSDVSLREECRAYWQSGFDALDVEGFRAYLHEMRGLGVLAPNNDGKGWHLRSPNVLPMIGTRDRVLTELVDAKDATAPSEFIALATRRALPDGTRAPLTAAQVDDLLGDHTNQVRLVLGSEATGIGKVAPTLRTVCDDLAGRYTLADAHTRRQFDEALVDGRPGERRVVLSDLLANATRDSACVESLQAALEHRPTTPGVTRAVVVVTAPEQMPCWREALADKERAGFGVVTLRRFDRKTLRVWSLDTGSFAADERQKRLLAATGGWPALLDRAVELAAEHESEDVALAELERDVASPDGAAAFVEQTGLTVDDDLAHVFDHITQLVGSGARLADLHDAASLAGHLDPPIAVACLSALAVFDVDDTGAYQVNPLLARCWPYHRVHNAM